MISVIIARGFALRLTNLHIVPCPQEVVIANVDKPMEWAMDVSDRHQREGDEQRKRNNLQCLKLHILRAKRAG